MGNYKIKVQPLPFNVIAAAVEGDEDAIADVVKHFSGYIAVLSARWSYDEYGNVHRYVDETVRTELMNKLMQSICKFKIV